MNKKKRSSQKKFNFSSTSKPATLLSYRINDRIVTRPFLLSFLCAYENFPFEKFGKHQFELDFVVDISTNEQHWMKETVGDNFKVNLETEKKISHSSLSTSVKLVFYHGNINKMYCSFISDQNWGSLHFWEICSHSKQFVILFLCVSCWRLQQQIAFCDESWDFLKLNELFSKFGE